ncbi:MAG: Na(+)-translocating NADH-quinone reductase subunit A [Dysgonamonadaceae bacterium]|nr:Na(+)-translocating NADH-quinone reductase subunit A [Dysgonamonadaceae bacterium]
MIQKFRIKNGLDIPLKGEAGKITKNSIESSFCYIYPDDYAGFVPRIAVKSGDKVIAGTAVLYDKNCPSLKIASPVSGEVIAVNRGEKRKLESIVISVDGKKEFVDFGKKNVAAMSPVEVKTALAEAGLLALFRQRPYDTVVNPEDTPRDIFVSGFYSAPLAPDFDYIVRENEADFQTGLEALAQITGGNVYVGIRSGGAVSFYDSVKTAKIQTVEFEGAHPAGNVGVQINRIKPVNKGETVWTVQPHEAIIIGRFFNKGAVDLTRMVALTGQEVNENARAYYPMLPGLSIEKLVEGNVSGNISLRYISGNVLTGTQITSNGYLHARDNQLTVIPEGDDAHELFGWIMPRLKQFSVNRSYPAPWLNIFSKKNYSVDARIKGGRRAMIMSNEWDKVLAMNDILPEFLIRAILANNITQMENLGIYEVAPEDFALCEFVDTSKMELQKIVREGLDFLKKEMA